MYQVIKQTPEEQLKIYMECSKEELANMLIECNHILDLQIVMSRKMMERVHSFGIDEEQKHTHSQDSSEKEYWHYGYAISLRDMAVNFPSRKHLEYKL
jgi:hypothetical protein